MAMELNRWTFYDFIAFFCMLWSCSTAVNVSHDGRGIIIDGQHRVLVSGSIHYPRSTVQMWPDLIRKSRQGGLDAIETYVFWDRHEPHRRHYDFTGNLDLIRFLKTIQNEGLYAILRIGPYVCAEWTYGGFPMWLHNLKPGIKLRTIDDVYLEEMKNFTTLIVNMVKEEMLFASQGGPIILAQIENEYGNIMDPYGEAGKAYIDWCASMAVAQNIGVPWIMCQQKDAPQPMINTCNGWYCDNFTPNNPNSPKMWTENWTGWFKNWGGPDPHRTAEDIAYAVARFFQTGGTLQNYYMYHGGTNFGRVAGGPYITTTYDYDAPLNEYGDLNQPKWGHLKELHAVLHSIEIPLTRGIVNNTDLGNLVFATIFATPERSSCFLGNTNQTDDQTVVFQGNTYTIPAWSVTILPDCKTEEYNTARVNAQTSVMVKKPNQAEEQPEALSWSWMSESIDDTVKQSGKGFMSANGIIDQKVAANDQSDYLWYMTRLDLNHGETLLPVGNMTIRVNGTNQILHAFVDGKYIGSQLGKDLGVFEKNVSLKHGKHPITLLSATVGFQNYGSFYDLNPNGVVGPVEISSTTADETVHKDLTRHKWSYKVGLRGYEDMLYKPVSDSASKWQSDNVPIDRMMTWYKTTFKAPLGTDPVMVDFHGLGKGEAWVNGHSIGRYWPSYIADDENCSDDPCDYRGPYSNKKCVYNCGNPTQRWYHVPRSFMNNDTNTLVLFEEFGGNPSYVNFQTIAVGSACLNVYEKKTLELSCHGKPISAIKFASYGAPEGSCGSFRAGSCSGSKDAMSILSLACVGKENCSIDVSDETFGSTNCTVGTTKKLAVEAVC